MLRCVDFVIIIASLSNFNMYMARGMSCDVTVKRTISYLHAVYMPILLPVTTLRLALQYSTWRHLLSIDLSRSVGIVEESKQSTLGTRFPIMISSLPGINQSLQDTNVTTMQAEHVPSETAGVSITLRPGWLPQGAPLRPTLIRHGYH